MSFFLLFLVANWLCPYHGINDYSKIEAKTQVLYLQFMVVKEIHFECGGLPPCRT